MHRRDADLGYFFFMAREELQLRHYSRAEKISDAAVHLVALAMALFAVPVLITMAAVMRGDALAVTSTSIYGATLILMIASSLMYNHLPAPRWTLVLKRLDHSAIHFKIAGTYTPFALLSGAEGTAILFGIWMAALIGTGLVLVLPRRSTKLAIVTCLAMGWAILFGGWDLLATLSPSVVILMVAGGVLYTFGTIFLMAERLMFHNTIWHSCVMVASVIFFIAVMTHLIQTA